MRQQARRDPGRRGGRGFVPIEKPVRCPRNVNSAANPLSRETTKRHGQPWIDSQRALKSLQSAPAVGMAGHGFTPHSAAICSR